MATRPEIHVAPDPDALAALAAREVAGLARESVAAHGAFRVALSGGSTPRRLYQLLAGDAGAGMPWGSVHVFWGDERQAPPDHAESNFRMAAQALLSKVPIPSAQVHRIRGEALEADVAAREYEGTLREAFAVGLSGVPRFDLVLLGLGSDGHTASLFPGSEALSAEGRLVVAPFITRTSAHRITLTLPVINAAANVLFLAAGADKATTVRRVIDGDEAVDVLPARGVHPAKGRLAWFLDEPAAAELGEA